MGQVAITAGRRFRRAKTYKKRGGASQSRGGGRLPQMGRVEKGKQLGWNNGDFVLKWARGQQGPSGPLPREKRSLCGSEQLTQLTVGRSREILEVYLESHRRNQSEED